jgi:crotonobetainyl-CoA:carnitine CoA-transferase CaiB-like acyl-CoA transferase
MTDVLTSWTGAVPPVTLPDGRALGGRVAGYGLFATRDGGWLSLGVLSEDHLWSALAEAVGLDDVASLTFSERVDQGEALQARLTTAVAGHDRDALVADLLAAGVPAAPVLSQAEVLAAEPLRERGIVTEGDDGHPVVAHPVQVDGTAPGRRPEAPPLVEGLDHLPRWS